jgi:hypothetical protein
MPLVTPGGIGREVRAVLFQMRDSDQKRDSLVIWVRRGGRRTRALLIRPTARTTVTLGGRLTALAVDVRRGRVYVVNVDAGTLSLLDAANGTLLRTVTVDPTPSLVYPLF